MVLSASWLTPCLALSRHAHLFEGIQGEYNLKVAAEGKWIEDFDEAITRVSFGWPSVAAYYEGSGSDQSIPRVAVPLLCIQVRRAACFCVDLWCSGLHSSS